MDFSVPQLGIDIETLAMSERSIIATLSAVIWNFDMDANITYDELLERTFYVKLDITDQIKRFGRTKDASTLQFWKTQPKEVREMSLAPSPNDVKIDDAFVALRKYLNDYNFDFKKSFIWTRGIAYDIPKIWSVIEDLKNTGVNSYNKEFDENTTNSYKDMFNNFRARDIRTYSDLIGNTNNGKFNLPKDVQPSNFIEHHAQHDIALDVFKMMYIYHSWF